MHRPPAQLRRIASTLPAVSILALCVAAGAIRCDSSSAPLAQQATTTTAPATQAATTQPASQPAPPRWERPRFKERQGHRDKMVADQIAAADPFRTAVTDPAVLAALRAVPRHRFVPPAHQDYAYADSPLPIGCGQTISQPCIVALMTELLQLRAGDKVLEIGTGSGYQAAVLSELTPNVFTIEIVEQLEREAAERFTRLGYRSIQSRLGDGYDGWPEHAPYDAIIVTCAAGHVPPPLWHQLKPGGRMVIPIGGTYETQRLVVLTKDADGGRTSRNVLPVRFVPMTGRNLEGG